VTRCGQAAFEDLTADYADDTDGQTCHPERSEA